MRKRTGLIICLLILSMCSTLYISLLSNAKSENKLTFDIIKTFENDEIGAIPFDFANINGCSNDANIFSKVDNTKALSGINSVKIFDNDNTKTSGIYISFPDSSVLTVDFKVYIESQGSYVGGGENGYGFAAALATGIPTLSIYNNPYYLLCFNTINGGNIHVNGANEKLFDATNNIELGKWISVRIAVNTNPNEKSFVFVGENSKGEELITKATGASGNVINTLLLGSYYGLQTGESWNIDDVRIRDSYILEAPTNAPLKSPEEENLYDFDIDELKTLPKGMSSYVENKEYSFINVSNKKSMLNKSLHIYDNDPLKKIAAGFSINEYDAITISMDFYLESYDSNKDIAGYGASIFLNGSKIDSEYISKDFKLALYFTSDGKVINYTKELFPIGTVKFGQWQNIKIIGNRTNGKIILNGIQSENIEFYSPLLSFKNLTFCSSGGMDKAQNESWFIDNLFIKNSIENSSNYNIKPIAQNIQKTCANTENVTFSLNATDENNDKINYKWLNQPKNGILSENNGIFTFTPSDGFVGKEILKYTANDGKADSEIATIEITISGQSKDFISQEEIFYIDRSDDNIQERQFPFVFKFQDTLFTSYKQSPDIGGVGNDILAGMTISRDGGVTWQEKKVANDFYFGTMFEKEGKIYAISYFTTYKSKTEGDMAFYTSVDKGVTWQKNTGSISNEGAPENIQFINSYGTNGLYFHRDVIVEENGDVLALMYGTVLGTEKYQNVLVKSIDNCKTWKIVSIISNLGQPEGHFKHPEQLCEPGFAKTQNGDILVVLRSGSWGPMYQIRSSDNGLTWSKPTTLPGLSREQAYSVSPQLVLLKSGVLALSYGRSSACIAFSTDGNGYEWDYYYEVENNGSDGMVSFVEVSPNRLLFVSDQGRTGAKDIAIVGTFLNIFLEHNPNYVPIQNDLGNRLNIKQATGENGLSEKCDIANLIDGDLSTEYIPNLPINYQGINASFVLELEDFKLIKNILVTHQFKSIWKYKVEYSTNGIDWKVLKLNLNNTEQSHLNLISANDRGVYAKYIKYTITGFDTIPNVNTNTYPDATKNYIGLYEIEIFGDEIDVQTISVAKNPNKLTYFVEDPLDLNGLEINATFNDGRIEKLSNDDIVISEIDMTTAGKKTITVSYLSRQVTFNIDVLDIVSDRLEFECLPIKLNYEVGEDINLDGLIVKLVYNNEKFKILESSKYQIAGFDSLTAGIKTIIISFENLQKSFEIEVKEKVISAVSIEKLPEKLKYNVGEKIILDGIVLKGIFASSDTILLETSKINEIIYDNTKPGVTTVTLKFDNGIFTTFDVEFMDNNKTKGCGAIILNNNNNNFMSSLLILLLLPLCAVIKLKIKEKNGKNYTK